jgi:hypothetical protein
MNVSMVGWEPGLLKITLIRAIRGEASLGLKDAKRCLDALLGGSVVTLSFTDEGRAARFAARLRSYGVIVETHASVADVPAFVGGVDLWEEFVQSAIEVDERNNGV